MIDLTGNIADDSRQHSIRAKCFHPSNTFIEFKKEEIEQSIPDRFEQMVRMYPDRLAVKTRSNQFTYDELNKAANRVAHAILSKRSESQEPVALLFGNNAPMIVAVLGVLKASKIYVPLDPSFPHARLASMLEDSEAELILTNSQNLSLGNELAPSTSQVVNIDGIDASLSDETIGFSIPPDALACILYTSGSTGEPKGVTQSHRTINHLVMRNTNSLHICTEDRQSLLSTYSHIAGVTDIFRALLNGACVFPFNLKEEGLVNLTDWLIKKEITIYHSVPSVFRYFINALSGEEEFPKLRLIHLGGEPVSKRDVELYKKHFSPDCLLLNNLGATELSGYRQYFINKETQIADNIAPRRLRG